MAIVNVSCGAAEAAPCLGMLVRVLGSLSKSRTKPPEHRLSLPNMDLPSGPFPACGSLNWALVYYCNEEPFSNVFFLALMWLNCIFLT